MNNRIILTACSLLLLGPGCSDHQSEAEQRFLSDHLPQEIIDLSPVITEDLPKRMWGHRALADNGFRDSTEFELIVRDNGLYVSNAYWTLMNHGGPHVDAPNHVIKGTAGVDQYELGSLFGPIKILDFRDRADNQAVNLPDIEPLDIRPGDVPVLLTGYVPPDDEDRQPTFAYLSAEAAAYLANIPVKCFVTDGLSIESFIEAGKRLAAGAEKAEEIIPVHYHFLSRNIPVVEQIVNAESLIGKENAYFIGLPLKVKDGDGSPVRAAAFVYGTEK